VECIQEIGDTALQAVSDTGDYGVVNSGLNLGTVMVVSLKNCWLTTLDGLPTDRKPDEPGSGAEDSSKGAPNTTNSGSV
jgi:hypothetical protein